MQLRHGNFHWIDCFSSFTFLCSPSFSFIQDIFFLFFLVLILTQCLIILQIWFSFSLNLPYPTFPRPLLFNFISLLYSFFFHFRHQLIFICFFSFIFPTLVFQLFLIPSKMFLCKISFIFVFLFNHYLILHNFSFFVFLSPFFIFRFHSSSIFISFSSKFFFFPHPFPCVFFFPYVFPLNVLFSQQLDFPFSFFCPPISHSLFCNFFFGVNLIIPIFFSTLVPCNALAALITLSTRLLPTNLPTLYQSIFIIYGCLSYPPTILLSFLSFPSLYWFPL